MRGFFALIVLALIGSGLTACDKPLPHRQEAFVFGTRVEVLIAHADEPLARLAASTVLREFDRLHRRYHAWEPSELMELNTALSVGKPRTVSPELAALLADAKRLAALSGALFDPGIGGLIHLWGFHSSEFVPVLPDPTKIAAWRAARPGIAHLTIMDNTIGSTHSGVRIDLGGYLKGFALDRADLLLRQLGIDNALVNIGGNILAIGTNNGHPWRVGIQHPRKPDVMATLELRAGEAIGTSGDYQRYFDLDGKRYCHLLDPRTGMPVMHTQSLTVLVTPRQNAGTLSDAASKPLFIAGASWPTLAGKMGVLHVLRVDSEGRVQASANFSKRLQFNDKALKPALVFIPDEQIGH